MSRVREGWGARSPQVCNNAAGSGGQGMQGTGRIRGQRTGQDLRDTCIACPAGSIHHVAGNITDKLGWKI